MFYLLITTHYAHRLIHCQNHQKQFCQLEGNATRTHLEIQQVFLWSNNEAEALVSSVGLWTLRLFSLSVCGVNRVACCPVKVHLSLAYIFSSFTIYYCLFFCLFTKIPKSVNTGSKGNYITIFFTHIDNYTFSTKHNLLLVSTLW